MGDPNLVWAGLIGLGGSIVVAVVSVGTTTRTVNNENRRASNELLVKINQTRSSRLRDLYEPFVALHLELGRVNREQTVLYEGENIASRNSRHLEEIRTASLRAMTKYPLIEIDPDAQPLKSKLNEVSIAGATLLQNATTGGLAASIAELNAYSELADELTSQMTEQLQGLDLVPKIQHSVWWRPFY
jgi:hypothetical protein